MFAHPNLYVFLGHLQRVTVDNQADITHLDRGLRNYVSVDRRLRVSTVSWTMRASKPASVAMTPARIYSDAVLGAMSHNMGGHTAALNDHLPWDSDNDDDGADEDAIQTTDQTPPQDAAVSNVW